MDISWTTRQETSADLCTLVMSTWNHHHRLSAGSLLPPFFLRSQPNAWLIFQKCQFDHSLSCSKMLLSSQRVHQGLHLPDIKEPPRSDPTVTLCSSKKVTITIAIIIIIATILFMNLQGRHWAKCPVYRRQLSTSTYTS